MNTPPAERVVSGSPQDGRQRPIGAPSQSPGLAAHFAAYPGNMRNDSANPERVESGCNPFRVELKLILYPGFATKSRSGLSESEAHAGTAEPFRVAPPEAAVYHNAITGCRMFVLQIPKS